MNGTNAVVILKMAERTVSACGARSITVGRICLTPDAKLTDVIIPVLSRKSLPPSIPEQWRLQSPTDNASRRG